MLPTKPKETKRNFTIKDPHTQEDPEQIVIAIYLITLYDIVSYVIRYYVFAVLSLEATRNPLGQLDYTGYI